MRKEEKEVAESNPCPALLYKELIENVALLSEIGWCSLCDMRLCCCAVGSISSGGVEEGEEGAREEDCGVYGK